MGSSWSASATEPDDASELSADKDADADTEEVRAGRRDGGSGDPDVTFLPPPEFPSPQSVSGIVRSNAPEGRIEAERFRILSTDPTELSREDLMWRLRFMEAKSVVQTEVVRDFVVSLALGPDMSRWYADLLRDLLRRVLLGLDVVNRIDYIECSFPSVPKEAPKLDFVQASEGSLSYSEWDVTWSPSSWWIAASIVGRQLTPLTAAFSVVATVSQFKVSARTRIACSRDCSAIRIGFTGQPAVELGVGTKAGIGSIPVPIQDRIETSLRTEVTKFINDNLMGQSSMVIPLRRKAKVRLNDDDVRVAEEAARRAAQFRNNG